MSEINNSNIRNIILAYCDPQTREQTISMYGPIHTWDVYIVKNNLKTDNIYCKKQLKDRQYIL